MDAEVCRDYNFQVDKGFQLIENFFKEPYLRKINEPKMEIQR
jgi:hypothetical protein